MKKAKFDDKMAKFESGAAFEKPATKNDTCISGVAGHPLPCPLALTLALPLILTLTLTLTSTPAPTPSPSPSLTSEAQGAR